MPGTRALPGCGQCPDASEPWCRRQQNYSSGRTGCWHHPGSAITLHLDRPLPPRLLPSPLSCLHMLLYLDREATDLFDYDLLSLTLPHISVFLFLCDVLYLFVPLFPICFFLLTSYLSGLYTIFHSSHATHGKQVLNDLSLPKSQPGGTQFPIHLDKIRPTQITPFGAPSLCFYFSGPLILCPGPHAHRGAQPSFSPCLPHT